MIPEIFITFGPLAGLAVTFAALVSVYGAIEFVVWLARRRKDHSAHG